MDVFKHIHANESKNVMVRFSTQKFTHTLFISSIAHLVTILFGIVDLGR